MIKKKNNVFSKHYFLEHFRFQATNSVYTICSKTTKPLRTQVWPRQTIYYDF